jgi:hypothetical protein
MAWQQSFPPTIPPRLFAPAPTAFFRQAEPLDLSRAFVFDPYLELEAGDSVLVRYGPFFRIEEYYGQKCLGRLVEAGELDREADAKGTAL